MENKLLWKADFYALHRIPGLLVTQKGTLLAYREARYETGDWAKMDILMDRSTDGGQTFEGATVLVRGGEPFNTVNNPVMLQDQRGRIHFLYCENYGVEGGRILRRYSDDEGCTWSEPVDITPFTAPDTRNAFALGPGHGICLQNGTLLIPVWMVPREFEAPIHSHGPSVVSTLCSKDRGETWFLGEQIVSCREYQNPNETTAAQLSDGRVYLNCRVTNHWRLQAYSQTGYGEWQIAPAKELIDPKCFGSAAVLGEKLYFANCENKEARENVALKASADGGKTWPERWVIDGARGGYVEMAADPIRNQLYILYETDWGKEVYLAIKKAPNAENEDIM